MFSDIGIDLGTSKTVIIKNKRILLSEPSVVLMDNYDEVPVSFGKYAYRAIGRSTERYSAVCPIERGVISDYDMAEQMLSCYMSRVIGKTVTKPRVVVSIPGGITSVERRSVIDAVQTSGGRNVCTIEAPVAAALGMGIDFTKPHGTVIVDIGSGTTDVAVMSMGGLTCCETEKIAGQDIDDAIIKYLKKEYNLSIGRHSAMQIKHQIGAAVPRNLEIAMVAKGLSATSGMPMSVEITGNEIYEAISEVVDRICRAIQAVINKTPPELVGDITEDGIYLTGGTALLTGLADALSQYLGVNIRVADDVGYCVARGIGIAMNHFDLLENGDYRFTTMQDLI
jgi:rod shape-determining protein MreB